MGPVSRMSRQDGVRGRLPGNGVVATVQTLRLLRQCPLSTERWRPKFVAELAEE